MRADGEIMKIKKLDTFVVQAGWRPWAFLKISSDEGVVGYADCTDANGSLPAVIAAIHDFEPYLLGKSAEHIELISDDLYRITRQSAGGVVQKAIAGVQNALLDLKARASLGVPVCSLLGGPVRRRIPLYWSHCGSTRLRSHQYLGEVPKVASLMDIRDLGQEVVE
ncbi:MAG: mandelate racemase/muconate lactonizing enzyme family protein, partial [Nitrospinota bacterium]|nr:mandelate racemase/muconate lactonizing enzyme family protein [Nitrospinota bacterium]